ncbi:MAG: NrfD/PsrC family molybdoenzyme membrane anchor subunit [Dehalococcoidia bacterium]
MIARHSRLDQAVLTPLARMPLGYLLWVALLVAVVAWGLYAYFTQLSSGLIVTAMRNKIMWGLYISNFVFFIGISHAGTLISAILRVAQAPWRMPITRMAEFITVVALMIGALMPLIDMGRPDRVLNLFIYGRWQSPLLWDVLAISTYLAGSLIYLYLPLIPDLALCRDSIAQRVSPLKRWFYTTLSIGWAGTPSQHKKLGMAIGMMMVIIIPVAISVHTVVSWIFAMTLRVGWNSTVLGIYFVAGAIFSGIATIIIVMAVLRKLYHLEEFITVKHFRYLGYLMGAFAVIMVYFNLSEHLTTGYKVAEGEGFLLAQLMTGEFSSLFWLYSVGGLLVPMLLVFVPWTRTILGIVVASVLVDVSMWIERFLIVVPTLRVPLMPYEPGDYSPTWVEWSIIAAAFAAFMLIITLFSRLFPVISVWEVKEQEERELAAQPRPGPERAVPIPGSASDGD